MVLLNLTATYETGHRATALNLGYVVGGEAPGDQLHLVRQAEQVGSDSVWAAEASGADVVTLLSWLAAQTTTVGRALPERLAALDTIAAAVA